MKNEINIDKNMFSPYFLPHLFDYSKRWNIYKGSAGSGKSWFIAQKLVLKGLQSKRRILVCRRYATTIENSVFKLFKEVIASFKLLNNCKSKQSPFFIGLPNGTEIIFIGLDEESKLLSLQSITDVFVEEVFEVPKTIVEQINLRLRGKKPNMQIYMAFNPISAKHWLYDYTEGDKQPKSLFYSQSTYIQNPFLDDDYIKAIEDLKRTNPSKYHVYGLGKWGADVDGIVYKNHKVLNFDINELLKNPKIKIRCGIDIGFVDATAIIATAFDEEYKEIYIIKEFYKRGVTLDEIADAIEEMGINKQRIFCDSADARAIDFLKRKGFKVEGAKKGAGSVKAGISYLQNHAIICHEKCLNTITELENYVYLRDKRTNQLLEDKYEHEFSHAMDAMRYAYSDLYAGGRLSAKTLYLGI